MTYLTAYLETKSGRLVEFEVEASYISETGDGWHHQHLPSFYEINDILINGVSVYKRMERFCPKKITDIDEQINRVL